MKKQETGHTLRNKKKSNWSATKSNKIVYSEPAEYFPESIRKELGLGEFAETNNPIPITTQKK